MAMGGADYWIKLIKEVPDERWHMGDLYHELTNRRRDERTIGYAESHDQALVGDQTLIFRLIGADMYKHMSISTSHLRVDRGVALHKLIRLVTLATAGHGYLNFMGNEFGHPEWIDFPREGNAWSYHYARRQWHLRDDRTLRYHLLADFDKAMMALARERRLLDIPGLQFLFEHLADQVLAFERAGLVFVFNFHPTESFSGYGIPAPCGKYRLRLDSDASAFGGHGRVAPGQEYFTEPVVDVRGVHGDRLRVYLPSRTALVLERVDTGSRAATPPPCPARIRSCRNDKTAPPRKRPAKRHVRRRG
jgi:1,4-alpha-glucan branching enzyme